MKSQKHNEGQLKEIKVSIEKDVVEAFEKMAERSGVSLSEMVVVALKRYRSSHSELEGNCPSAE